MIYEIICNITNERYFGSTRDKNRLKYHVSSGNMCSSKQIISRGNWTFKILEEIDNPTDEELLIIEKKYINENECININSPLRTYDELKEYEKKYHKKYYNEHRIKIIENSKKWYDDNKDDKLIKQKIYHDTNKDIINAKKKEVITCSCGMTYTYSNKLRHFNTKFHINNVIL